MKAATTSKSKKYFTVDEANAMLPLLRSILATSPSWLRDLKQRRTAAPRPTVKAALAGPHQEEVEHVARPTSSAIRNSMRRVRARARASSAVELKDYFIGLVDFPALDGRPRGLSVLAAGRAGSRPLARDRRRLRRPTRNCSGRQRSLELSECRERKRTTDHVPSGLLSAGFPRWSAVFFLFIHLMMGKFIRPSRPETEKLTIYECGEPTVGSAWIQFDLRYYVVALLFVIFDVEVAFFFPVGGRLRHGQRRLPSRSR